MYLKILKRFEKIYTKLFPVGIPSQGGEYLSFLQCYYSILQPAYSVCIFNNKNNKGQGRRFEYNSSIQPDQESLY